MKQIIQTPLFSLFITVTVYSLVSYCSRKIKSSLFNPLLISSFIIIGILSLVSLPYDIYAKSTDILTRLIGPATVCLAIPLYKSTAYLKKYIKPIIMGVTVGVMVHGICIGISTYILGWDLGILASIFPKSVTTAIAQDLAISYGGNASITVPIVIITGTFGATVAPSILKWFKIHHPIAKGIGLGTSAHAVGTSKAIEIGEIEGSMAGLALILTGIITVIFAPLFMTVMSLFM